jgi:hypothetical protein
LSPHNNKLSAQRLINNEIDAMRSLNALLNLGAQRLFSNDSEMGPPAAARYASFKMR